VDVVYRVKPKERNAELRFSLRSLAHLDHDRVWLAGFQPSWIRNVGLIPTRERHDDKWQNIAIALEAVCSWPELSDRFVLMDDDFFVMQPVDEVPTWHRGPASEFLSRHGGDNAYHRGLRATVRFLQELGHADPLSYELHVPMVFDKAAMADALSLPTQRGKTIACLQQRTLYGNVVGIGGDQVPDVKVVSSTRNQPWRERPFISTTDHSFSSTDVGKFIRAAFPDASPYEEAA
jgi:hypothetical protein